MSVFRGYDRDGRRVVGIITGRLVTKWSVWLAVRTASGVRLIQCPKNRKDR